MIKRDYMAKELQKLMAQSSTTPVVLDENDNAKSGYQLGQHLGYQDGLRAALQLLNQLPSYEPIPEEQRFVRGQSSTFQYARSEEE